VFNSPNSRISIFRVRTRSRMDSASMHLQSLRASRALIFSKAPSTL
jgi:hypothetical protein